MAYNKILRIVALVIAITLAVAVVFSGKIAAFYHEHSAVGEGTANSQPKTVYVCPMGDPGVFDKPGKCPKCGMELVTKKLDAGTAKLMNVAAKSSPEPTQHDMTKMPAQSTPAAPATKAPSGDRKILFWYDPMHPQYKSAKPGTAPDCGMDLVPKYADEQPMQMAPGSVMISADKQQLIGVRTAKVARESLVRTVRTTGQLVADESKIAHIHVKVPGFVEDAYVNFVGQLVKKGQPIFTFYSPDLLSAQQEYLIAKRGAKTLGTSQISEVSQGAQSLLRATRERLRLWDISDEQIKKLDETGEASRELTFYSPITGFVVERKVFHHTAVTPDTELYMISDLSTIWVNADVYEYEVPFVKVGQRADIQLSYYPGKTWSGRVNLIYPTLDPTTRTVKVRIDLPNPNFELKPQMFADVRLKIDYGNQVVVPQEAVLDSGKEQTVFVAHEGGSFEPRKISTGAKLEGKVVVLSGLKPGETIVTSGNFLIDSESRMKSAMGAMQH